MRLYLGLLAIPLFGVVPAYELGGLAALLSERGNSLRAGARVQITGTLSESIEHEGSVVIALFDKDTATAAGCTINGKTRRDLPEMVAGRRYSVEGTLLRWEPQYAGTAILLDHCRVLPDLIELKPGTIYIGVVGAGEREVGFQLRIEEGGEGPFHARLTPIDSGKFLEEWENRLALDRKLRLTRGPTDWTGSYSRAAKSMQLVRQGQVLDLVLQSPASFAGVLTVRKGTQTQVRMMVANSSGHLFGFPAQPNPQQRRPAVAPAQPRAPRRVEAPLLSIGEAETIAANWFRDHAEYGAQSVASAKRVEGGWLMVYELFAEGKTGTISLRLTRNGQEKVEVEIVPAAR